MKNFLEKMEVYEPLINPKKMPKIDLYMDQVIQMFEQQYEPFLRTNTEKVMTKTMINNYSKEKLYEPVKKKKYDMNHLMLLSMIYQLKNTLSIADIKKITQNLSVNETIEPSSLENFYEQLYKMDDFIFDLVKDDVQVVENKVETLDSLDEQTKRIFYANLFSQMSTYYKQLAEQLVDEVEEVKDPKYKK